MHSKLVLISRLLMVASALAVFCSSPAGAQGSTPANNDICASATVVPNMAAASFYLSPVVEVSNTSTVGDPAVPLDCAVNVSRSIWYRFTPNTTALYTFSLGADTATTVLDTVMAIYTSPGCGGPFVPFECNDDPGPLSAGISTTLTANTTCYIVVWVGPVTDVGNTPLNVQLRVSRPVVPGNDTCEGAEPIPTTTFPYLTAITDTTLATESDDPVSTCLAFTGARSVWYQFTPPATGIYIFSTGSDTQTTVDDTALEIFRSTGGCNGPFTAVGCSDNGLGRATATATLTNGQTYYIVVWDNSFPSIPGEQSEYIPGETRLQLRVSKAAAPTVLTLGASSIASTGAVLTAAINPSGAQTRFSFEWGTTTAYTATSAVRLLLASTGTTTSSVPIAGFPPNTTIHYRIVATNSVGRAAGLDQTFFWSGARPTLGHVRSGANVNFQLSFPGNPRQLYLVEMSTNLTAWSNLGSAPEISPGQFQFTQNGAAFLPSRFYRVRLP